VKTAAQLQTELLGDCFPSGQPENLVTQHRNLFQEAFAEICKWSECEQGNNVNVIQFCKTNYKCGMTVVPRPRGIIQRIYTLANGLWCDPVFYRQVEWPIPEDWARNLFKAPVSSVLPEKLPFGFAYADKSTDSRCGRARTGVWAIYNNNIYIAPWIQSNEVVVIEWKGIKEEWEDEDPINPARDYRKAVKLYFQYAHERDYGDGTRAVMFKSGAPIGSDGFDRALADLMWQCREETKVRRTHEPTMERNRWLEEIQDDVPPTMIEFAHIGNAGSADTNEGLVAALVKTFNPLAIFTSGNNATGGEYDLAVGQFYHDYVGAYVGSFGQGADINAFWPAPGATDWASNALADYLAFFTTLPGNQRYYDVAIGQVHFFVLDDSSLEVDGNSSSSIQGEWLQAKLGLSTAAWKIVILNRSPYSSQGGGGVVGLRWPFETWGAHLVLSGDLAQYERLLVGAVPFIVNGLGGITPILALTGPDDANSEFRYDTGHGAGKITATMCSLKYEFLDLAGEVVDTVTLTKTDCSETGTAATVVGPAAAVLPLFSANPLIKEVHSFAGDPNGFVRSTSPAICLDTTNGIIWQKNDGLTSNLGWH
jgi:tartrate-resistant acid phosphatase type 5